MKRTFAIACALALALTACSGGSSSSSQNGGTSSAQSGPAGSESMSGSQSTPAGSAGASSSQPDPAGAESASSSQLGETRTATLYIGMDGQFSEYPLETSEEITPTLLVEEMARLTGWNLDLDDEVISGKGGITVTFADTCALFAGPPDPQKDEFHVFARRAGSENSGQREKDAAKLGGGPRPGRPGQRGYLLLRSRRRRFGAGKHRGDHPLHRALPVLPQSSVNKIRPAGGGPDFYVSLLSIQASRSSKTSCRLISLNISWRPPG